MWPLYYHRIYWREEIKFGHIIIHGPSSMDHPKLYKQSMLYNDEEKTIVHAPKELVTKVGI
jgi:hypothetical protein